MSQTPEPSQKRSRYWLNLTLAGAAGQVGCVTLVIVLAAVFLGLWLDSHFHTRPVFTLILLVASIPVSVGAMVYVVRLVTSKIKSVPSPKNQDLEKKVPPQQEGS